MHRENIWLESEDVIIDDITFALVNKEYKPKWPIFLNKYDLVKVKPYYDKDNYHYAIINNFQQKAKSGTLWFKNSSKV